MTGVHTPLKSGNFASACQSARVGAGLMTSLSADSAGGIAIPASATKPRIQCKRTARNLMCLKDTQSMAASPHYLNVMLKQR
jgi:hypothetical protein